MTGRRQAQHDLSECYYFTHNAAVNFRSAVNRTQSYKKKPKKRSVPVRGLRVLPNFAYICIAERFSAVDSNL